MTCYNLLKRYAFCACTHIYIKHVHTYIYAYIHPSIRTHKRSAASAALRGFFVSSFTFINAEDTLERWGAGVETQKNVREEIGGWGRVFLMSPTARR